MLVKGQRNTNLFSYIFFLMLEEACANLTETSQLPSQWKKSLLKNAFRKNERTETLETMIQQRITEQTTVASFFHSYYSFKIAQLMT